MMAKYAPYGWYYYSVITPSITSEVLAPEAPKARTAKHRREMRKLNADADDYGAYVYRSLYALT